MTQTTSHIPFIKLALGLHHFNIAYVAGNEASYHRQVREALLPFLQMLERHPSWQTTIEMSGFSLEFLAQHYPNILDYIKSLIENGQIELISCTYAPQLWIAYPFEDLIKSIEWTWHQMGSGERYSKAATSPSDWKHYVLDPDWLSLAEHCLENIEKRGFRLTTINKFLVKILPKEYSLISN